MTESKWKSGDKQQKANLILQRWADLKLKRSPWIKQWQDVAKYISPFSGRFDLKNHGQNRDQSFVLDAEPIHDVKILTSGLMSGASSPARPWFKISPENEKLSQNYAALEWCSSVEKILLKIFQKSNTYSTLHMMYKDLVLFGTACDLIYQDADTHIKHHFLSCGEYCLDTNQDGEVDTLYRNFELTTLQAVKSFGLDVLPHEIQDAYHRGDTGAYWEFLHAIEPRIDRDYTANDNLNMKWGSYYIAVGSSSKGILKESGFDYFPAIVPRWDVQGINVYGTSPAIEMLPDVKQLMQETYRKAELIDLYTKPPLQAPSSARQSPINLASGAINFTQSTGNETQIRPIISAVGDLNALMQDIAQIKDSLKRGFFVDLFMIVQQTAGDRRTTVEINALQQEQMLTLGSVMERIQNEALGRLVSITATIAGQKGLLPNLPDILLGNGAQVGVEFTSVLAQAQKAVDINSVDRFFSALSASAQIMPEVLDRLDPDGYVEEYRERLGVAPKIVRSKEEADKIRQQRQQAQMQQAQMQQESVNAAQAEQLAQAQKTGADASLAMQQLDVMGSEML